MLFKDRFKIYKKNQYIYTIFKFKKYFFSFYRIHIKVIKYVNYILKCFEVLFHMVYIWSEYHIEEEEENNNNNKRVQFLTMALTTLGSLLPPR